MKPKKAGRPLGSRNFEYEPVIEVPPACVSCGCTTFETVGKPPIIRRLSGTRDGHAYDRVVWTDKQCTSCNQRVRVISYQKTIARNNKTTV